jgi:hypothetical protein
MTAIPINYLAGSFADGPRDQNGAAFSCAVDWDHEHKQWRAEARPLLDEPPIEAWADTSHAAALALIARWLGCEPELWRALESKRPQTEPTP